MRSNSATRSIRARLALSAALGESSTFSPLALASQRCGHCMGTGAARTYRPRKVKPCNCVWRQVFEICWREYGNIRRRLNDSRYYGGNQVVIDFTADVEATARRVLPPEMLELFRAHFQRGESLERLALLAKVKEKRSVWRKIQVVKEVLGEAFTLTRPYPLYPPTSYYQLHNPAPDPPAQPASKKGKQLVSSNHSFFIERGFCRGPNFRHIHRTRPEPTAEANAGRL